MIKLTQKIQAKIPRLFFPGEAQRQFIKYGVIGGIGTSLDFTLFYVMHSVAGAHYLIANMIGVFIGVTNNFLMNSFLNFKVTDRLWRRYFIYLAIAGVGVGLNSVCLWGLIEYRVLPALPAKLVVILAFAGVQFLLNKGLTFREHRVEHQWIG